MNISQKKDPFSFTLMTISAPDRKKQQIFTLIYKTELSSSVFCFIYINMADADIKRHSKPATGVNSVRNLTLLTDFGE